MNKITGIRLLGHQLLSKKCQRPKDLVSWMGALQAQDYSMAKWAVGIRLPGYTNTMVEDAFNRGDILRTHVMRPTWHFVSPENIRWMLSLSADRIKASARSRDRDLEITEALYRKSNQIIRKTLEGYKAFTREALGRELEKAKITVNASRLVHFLMRAELDALVCSGPLQGKKHTYALLDERVPQTKPLSKEETLAKLAQIYFTSHGPAALQDFVWWSGLSPTEAKKALESVQSDFLAEKTGDQTYWIARSAGAVKKGEKTAHLLPAFDEYIIAYRDRTAAIPLENQKRAISSNGIFHPVIVANGQAVGLWKKAAAKTQPLVFDFFEELGAAKSQVNKAADAFTRFLEKSR
jgi:hypothetical protein